MRKIMLIPSSIQISILISILCLLVTCTPTTLRKESKLKYLVADPKLQEYFEIAEEHITMYASPARKKTGFTECRLYRDEFPLFMDIMKYLGEDRAFTLYRGKGRSRFSQVIIEEVRTARERLLGERQALKGKPLAGVRIALDPGHTADSLETAIREEKYTWLESAGRGDIRFHESSLTMATALILKNLLERDGAAVMVTRPAQGLSSFGKSFDEWRRDGFYRQVSRDRAAEDLGPAEAAKLLSGADEDEIFRYYANSGDLRNRAKLINDFSPDLTVVIHYNSSGIPPGSYSKRINRVRAILRDRRLDAGGKISKIERAVNLMDPAFSDYAIVYVPGAFAAGELSTPRARMELLRLLVSSDLDESISLARRLIRNLTSTLSVPVMPRQFADRYHLETGISGVYCRNLKMTQLVHGPVVLGEPFIQNNLREAENLSVSSATVAGVKTSPRVNEAARAYYNAIIEYIVERRERKNQLKNIENR